MFKIRNTGTLALAFTGSVPLLGGTGRPSDGLLSFILVLGFLLLIFGVLSLIDYIKRKIRAFLMDIMEMN